jgi:TolA-binding protein
MAAGEYQIVVDEALSAGLEQSLRARPSGDLSALSDAARYVGRADVARRALVAQRQRFPETDSAASAAFHLGTLAEKRDPTSREALKWYDLYLSTAPAGTFVPETLGRKMLILQRRDDMTAARSIAEAYRRQFPGGPYRRQADRILARP